MIEDGRSGIEMGVERTKKVQAVVATTYLCLVSSMIIFPLMFSRYQIVPVLVWHNDSGRHLFLLFFSFLLFPLSVAVD